MEEQPIHLIRESTRNLLKLNRQLIREQRNDYQRAVKSISINSGVVVEIANKLKSKSSITASDLHLLKNALIDDPKNIEVVLSTNGCLRGLVRELSGADVNKQLAAAGCFCNLALGDSHACGAIAKAAGPYLIATLDNLSTELAVTCAWCVGNVCGGGGAGAAGAGARLCGLLARGGERAAAAVYALLHYACNDHTGLRSEHVADILKAYLKLELTAPLAQLLFVVSCQEQLPHFTEEIVNKIVKDLIVSAFKHCNQCHGAGTCCELLYLVRALANAISDSNSAIIINIFETKNVCEHFTSILRSDNIVLTESLLWMLGNLYKYRSDCKFFNML